MEELEAAGRAPRGGSFPVASRFPPPSSSSSSSGRAGAGGGGFLPASSAPQGLSKGVFSGTQRFPEKANDGPAPGDYKLRRLCEDVPPGKGKQLTADRAVDLVQQIEGERTLRNQSCNFMASQVSTGVQCERIVPV